MTSIISNTTWTHENVSNNFYIMLCCVNLLANTHIYIFTHQPRRISNCWLQQFLTFFRKKKHKKHKNNNQNKTPNSGYLGSRNDEERSEMRYAVRIAEFRESSELWTHIAPQGIPWSMFVSVASEHLPQGPTRPLNKGLLVGANWARGLERTSQLGAYYLISFGNE